MRTKVTLVLIFLNVALFFFIFKFERHWRTEAASLEARRRVLGPEAADIRSLEVSSPSGPLFALARTRDNSWALTKPLDWPANLHAVSSILHELQLLEHETSFPTQDLGKNNNPTLADYGLDKPKLTVAFTSGDPAASGGPLAPVILRIGDTTKVGNRVYILSPNGDRIHVVEREKIDSLFLPVDQLRADALLTIPVFEAGSLSVQTANPDPARGTSGARVLIRRDGPRWGIFAPIAARASKTQTEVTISRLVALRAKSFPAASPATLPSVAPALRVTLEGNNRHETLFLGEPVPAAANAAANNPPPSPASSTETEYFGQLEGRAAIFTVVVPNDLLKTLRNATDPATGRPGAGLRETRILDFEPAAVSAVTLAAPAPAATTPITLQRLDAAPKAPDAGAWQLVARAAGNDGLQTVPADRAAIEHLLGVLAELSAQTFVSDNPSSAELENWGFNRPEREITLVLATAVAAPAAGTTAAAAPARPADTRVVLRLGVDPSRKVYARVGTPNDPGSSIYAVDVDLAREFPVQPLAWRDRGLPFIPPNARLAALKLTDLTTHQPVLEVSFDAAGQPAATPTPPRNPAALQNLVKSLRPLRANRFRPEPFGDKLVAGGEERAWRYQLDATLSLPGGAGGEQTETKTLLFTDRVGGAEQIAGSKEFDVVFEIEQPLLDALWSLTARDPGPPPAETKG
ncbi:MAG TPA: DUF4340 domain-containing protein [Opitutaceae bacterium]|nr:DUF4340 domain-containing protein [Opitutaceae bacterium]